MEECKCAFCSGNVESGEGYRLYHTASYRWGQPQEVGWICEACADNGEAFQCPDCGDYFDDSSDIVEVRGLDEDICVHCAANSYYHCDDCGCYVTDDCVVSDDYDTVLCDRCFEDGDYVRCDQCGVITSEYHDTSNGYLCNDCYSEYGSPYVNDYCYKPDPIFHYVEDGEEKSDDHSQYENVTNRLFYGVELETDDGSSVDNCADDLRNIDTEEQLFYMKHDGSLNDGIEIVTHPCTLQYHLDYFPWDDITKASIENGFKSHKTDTCGLHVHVSKVALGSDNTERDLTTAKLILFIDKFWDTMVKFSRRDYSQLRWANKNDAKIEKGDSTETAIEKSKNTRYDRYHAVNITNDSTVEFRIFRGTLKVSTIKATLEFLDNLVYFCMTHTLEEVSDAHFFDIVDFCHYDELDQYIAERGITEPDLTTSISTNNTVF